jgi:hypothetical protein
LAGGTATFVGVVVGLTVMMLVLVLVLAIVIVGVAVPGRLQHQEGQAGGDQQRADDRVLGVLDGRAKLQSDHDDQRAKHHRHEHVRNPGQSREPRELRQRVAAGAADHGQRHPVVGQDRVAEAHAGGGDEQGGGRAHLAGRLGGGHGTG